MARHSKPALILQTPILPDRAPDPAATGKHRREDIPALRATPSVPSRETVRIPGWKARSVIG